MKKIIATLTLIGAIFMFVNPTFAANSNTPPITDKDFSDVQNLLNQMTPAQRAEVLKQAKEKEQALQKLSPEEQDKLRQQLLDVSSTIKMDEIDPAKLSPSKSKDTGKIMGDLNTYQKKYDAGKINNSAVKTNDDKK
jgi:hypothetical protein